MPNWCNNSLTLTGPEDVIKEIVANGFSFQKLIPCPQELIDTQSPPPSKEIGENNVAKYGYADWYSWNVANWGTKWDVGPLDCDFLETENGVSTLYLNFDSAWSPPVEALRKIHEKYSPRGLKMEGEYIETGCSFLGTVVGNEDGFSDEYEEWGNTDELAAIVKEMNHSMGESELQYLRDMEEEEKESSE
jgi:hypothetical protein